MNAASRALEQGAFITLKGHLWVLSREMLGTILLVVAVLGSALSVIYVKDLNRQLFGELQALHQIHEELSVQQGQLLLEQNTWAASTRVQAIAQQQLGMVSPAPKDVRLVTFRTTSNE